MLPIQIVKIYVRRGNCYCPSLLYARIATGAYCKGARDLVLSLNDELKKRANNPRHRDELAKFWIQQDQERIYLTHCKYLVYHSYLVNGAPVLSVPAQEKTHEVLQAFQPRGLELPKDSGRGSTDSDGNGKKKKKKRYTKRVKKSQNGQKKKEPTVEQ